MGGTDQSENKHEQGAQVTIYQCDSGHGFCYPHGSCPVCSGATHQAEVDAVATVVSHTLVRVTPSGPRFRLGLAELRCGAKTLCIIDDGVDVDNGQAILYFQDGLYHVKSTD